MRCRLFGHRYFWLDVNRQCHCVRCGKPNVHYFVQQAALEQIRRAAEPTWNMPS